MSAGPRRARLRALAKINLSLKVLGKRPDGYHELRTVFQTVSLADTLEVEFEPARRTRLEVSSRPEIPGNLVERAAWLALEAMRVTGRVTLRLRKRIPVGSGLGGGSSDAAAVLLALPVLAGRRIPPARLIELGGELGSDVPFFLLGGTALGLGRGTELYPLADVPAARGLLVAPGFAVSTAEAYQALELELTSPASPAIISSFQSWVWGGPEHPRAGPDLAGGENDFEAVVFTLHPGLGALKRRLEESGAKPAMLSGSGSAMFGLFVSPAAVQRARRRLGGQQVFPISLVGRARYRRLWWRQLEGHVKGRSWPPASRYAP
ncbi:MAG: 4-(cytidine 5'-diphospho)-2-C-methyl-D-erythritol kinase [Acidobacteria bacterium]|nr:4-(cytidine 5'-diphospho)-2-C-methyl-D-erythritol kinase [Acidobacteriota bacterium]